MENNKEILLQVPLKGEIANMFEKLFLDSHLESRTEYVRLLISKEYTNVSRADS